MNRLMNMRQPSSPLLSDSNNAPPTNDDDGDHRMTAAEASDNPNGLIWMEEAPISSITMSVSTLSESAMDDDDYYDGDVRQGTLMSARMNLLTSMVGGGSLSLPLAYHQMGNICMAPLTMIIIAVCMDCSVRCLIISGQITAGGNNSSIKKGTVTLEQVAYAAYGPAAKYCTMALVFFICFFTIVGYGVLLRDLLQPLTDMFHGNLSGNQVMMTVVLLVTPLTTLSSLTALRNVGAASMGSVLLMAICISYRSIQCLITDRSTAAAVDNSSVNNSSSFLTLVPHSIQDVLQSLPILLSVFVCHFNVLPVHNELRNPTPARVHNLIRTTYASSTLFYIALGIIGSFYAKCSSPSLQSNILKSFPDDDLIILVGRTCLTFTIALAFPMLVVPARNVLLSSMTNNQPVDIPSTEKAPQMELEEELLPRDDTNNNHTIKHSKCKRVVMAVLITWLATAIACCVDSIAVVWDFLGSSLSIMLAFVLPCGSYLKLTCWKLEETMLRMAAWTIIFVSVPIMVIGTSNAFYTTFLQHAP